jgi:hypothetical protein
MNPALRDPHNASRKSLSQFKRRFQIHFKRPQIASVHAYQVASCIHRPLQFFTIVHFAQHIQPALTCP